MGRGGGGGGRSGGFSSGGGRGFSGGGSRPSSGRGGGMGGSSRGRGGSMGPMGPGRMPGGPVPPRRPMMGMPFFGRRRYYGAPYGGGGCLGPFGMLVIIVILFMMVSFGSCGMMMSGPGNAGHTQTTTSTITRTKLESNLCTTSSEWIRDELGWLERESTVKSAMQEFYEITGVQPYLLITDNLNGKGRDLKDSDAEDYLQNLYDSLYDDEGHMIFAFIEYEQSRYVTYVYTGTAADSVIDSEAREIILSIADRYYTDSSLSDDAYFAKIFTASAEEIMRDVTGSAKTKNVIKIILVIAAVLIIVLMIVCHIQDSRTKEAEHLKEVLDTPIGESPTDEELLKKYGDDSDKS